MICPSGVLKNSSRPLFDQYAIRPPSIEICHLPGAGICSLLKIVPAGREARITLSCQYMSNSRHLDRGVRIRSFGVTFPDGEKPPAPLHGNTDWHQLIYATRGVMTVYTEQGA